MTDTIISDGENLTNPDTGESTPITDPAATESSEAPDSDESIAKILERFENPEEMAKSIKAGTAKISEQGAEIKELREKLAKLEEGAKPDGDDTEVETPAGDAPAVDAEVLGAVSVDYAANGELSEESLNALARMGLTKEAANEVASALFERSMGSALRDAGVTAEQYNAAAEWAADNWSDEQSAQHARYLASSDPNIRAMAVQRLMSAAGTQAASGQPARVHAEGTSTGGDEVTPFESVDEMVTARNDPRFQTDPAYRKKVMARTGVSTF